MCARAAPKVTAKQPSAMQCNVVQLASPLLHSSQRRICKLRTLLGRRGFESLSLRQLSKTPPPPELGVWFLAVAEFDSRNCSNGAAREIPNGGPGGIDILIRRCYSPILLQWSPARKYPGMWALWRKRHPEGSCSVPVLQGSRPDGLYFWESGARLCGRSRKRSRWHTKT